MILLCAMKIKNSNQRAADERLPKIKASNVCINSCVSLLGQFRDWARESGVNSSVHINANFYWERCMFYNNPHPIPPIPNVGQLHNKHSAVHMYR